MHLPGLRPSSKTSRKMPAEWCWNHGEKSLPNAGLDFQICVDWWNHGEKSLDFIFRLFFIFLDMCLICGTRGNSSAAISQSLASCGLGRLVTLLCSDISCAVHKQASIVGERLGHVGTCWDMLGHAGTCWDIWTSPWHLSGTDMIPASHIFLRRSGYKKWRLCWRDHCPWNAETLVWILSAILYRHEKHSASVPSHVCSSNLQFLDASSASSSRGGSFPE
jgi:hypothetical protein